MSDFDFELAGYAGGRMFRNQIRQQHDELVNAIKKGRSAELESPYKKSYKLLAANGVDLIAHCYQCNGNLRFLPEYAGDTTDCIYCKKPVTLCLPNDLDTSRCDVCGDAIKYLNIGWNEPFLCFTCGPQYTFSACPYCKETFFMLRSIAVSDNPVCPIAGCNKKLKLIWLRMSANIKIPGCGIRSGNSATDWHFYSKFKKIGFFS